MRRNQKSKTNAAIALGVSLALFGLLAGGTWIAANGSLPSLSMREPTLDASNMDTVWASLKEIKAGLSEAERGELDRALAMRTLPTMMQAAFKGDKHPDISQALRPLHGKTGREILASK